MFGGKGGEEGEAGLGMALGGHRWERYFDGGTGWDGRHFGCEGVLDVLERGASCRDRRLLRLQSRSLWVVFVPVFG